MIVKVLKIISQKIIKNIINKLLILDKKFSISKEKFIYSGDELRRRQYLAGMNIEDLEIILHPMVEEAKEAVGSMGDDTPVCSVIR